MKKNWKILKWWILDKLHIISYSDSFVFETWTWTYRERTVNVPWTWFDNRFWPFILYSMIVSYRSPSLIVHRSWPLPRPLPWPFLTVPDRFWPFLTVSDRSWQFLKRSERVRNGHERSETARNGHGNGQERWTVRNALKPSSRDRVTLWDE